MIKTVVFFVLLICPFLNFGQDSTKLPPPPEPPVFGDTTGCYEMKQEAKQDFNSGKKRYLMGFGLVVSTDEGTFQDSFIYANYGVDIYWGGCIMRLENCYEQEMKSLIRAEFGDDWLTKAISEASKAYELYLPNHLPFDEVEIEEK
jgi:hypothetical protein